MSLEKREPLGAAGAGSDNVGFNDCGLRRVMNGYSKILNKTDKGECGCHELGRGRNAMTIRSVFNKSYEPQ